MTVLNELWYGNISPNSDCRIATKETKELTKHRAVIVNQSVNTLQ